MTNQRFNRLAATEIMRWTLSNDQNDCAYWVNEDGLVECWVEGFIPAADESDAAQVREKMRADGWEIHMTAHKRGDTVEMYRNGSNFVVFEEVRRMCYALTACALLAVGAIKESDLNAKA